MKRFSVALLIAFTMGYCLACNNNQLLIGLTFAKQGLEPACQPDQDTLPDYVCKEGLDAVNLAISIANKDDAATRANAKKILADIVAKYPELDGWFNWFING